MFKIIIAGVSDRELGSVLKTLRIPEDAYMEPVWYADPDDDVSPAPPKKRQKKRKKKGRRRGHEELLTTKLTMTGKVARQSGSAIAKGLELFEKCEADLGIGSVMVVDFRAYLKTNRMQKPENLQKRMVRDGYLDYLD